MGVKSMITKSLVVSLVGTVAVMSTKNYNGSLRTTLEQNITDLETMLQGYSAKYNEQKGTIAQHLATIGNKETTINNLNSQITNLNKDKTDLTTERDNLISEINGIASVLGISTSNKDMDVLVDEIVDNLNQDIQTDSTELSTFKTIAVNLGKTEEEANGMSRNQLVAFINSTVVALNTEMDKANTEIARLEGEVEKANTEIARLEGEISKLQAEVTRLEGIITQYENDLTALNSKAQSVKDTYKDEYNNEILNDEVVGEGEGTIQGGTNPPTIVNPDGEEGTTQGTTNPPAVVDPEGENNNNDNGKEEGNETVTESAKDVAYNNLSANAKLLADTGYENGDITYRNDIGSYIAKSNIVDSKYNSLKGTIFNYNNNVSTYLVNVTNADIEALNAWANM